MLQEEEFSVYEKYVDDMLAPHGKERLNILLKREDLSKTLEVGKCLSVVIEASFKRDGVTIGCLGSE